MPSDLRTYKRDVMMNGTNTKNNSPFSFNNLHVVDNGKEFTQRVSPKNHANSYSKSIILKKKRNIELSHSVNLNDNLRFNMFNKSINKMGNQTSKAALFPSIR